ARARDRTRAFEPQLREGLCGRHACTDLRARHRRQQQRRRLRTDGAPLGVRSRRSPAGDRRAGYRIAAADPDPAGRGPAARDDDRAERGDRRRLAYERRLRVAAAGRSAWTVRGNDHLHPDRAVMVATPPVALSASPARVMLAAHETQTIRVTNAGKSVAFVDIVPAGFALGIRGRPRVVPQSGARWLRVRPRHVALGPGRAASVS